MMKNTKKERAITLIALVITIIVLIILASISINMLLGNNGILTKVKDGKDKTIVAQEEEQTQIAYASAQIKTLASGILASDLQTELDALTGAEKTEVTGSDTFTVHYIETDHYYKINDKKIRMVNGSQSTDIQWVYEENIDGNIEILGFNIDEDVIEQGGYSGYRAYLEMNEIVVPSTIDGKNVVSVSLYGYSDGNIIRNVSGVNKVTFPNGVNLKSSGEFYDVTTVILPDDLTEIPEGMFDNWCNLSDVVLPDGVTIIGDNAFYDCNISSIVIPNGVTYIGDYAFSYNSLESIVIPNGVTRIGECAFESNSLESIVIPSSVTYIGDYAFEFNSLESIEIPSGVTYIGESAFYSNSLSSIEIPNSVTEIGDSAFANNFLESIEIPSSVTYIGGYAFSWNRLSRVEIPNSVTEIGDYAFDENDDLIIEFPDGKNNAIVIPKNKWGASKIFINGEEFVYVINNCGELTIRDDTYYYNLDMNITYDHTTIKTWKQLIDSNPSIGLKYDNEHENRVFIEYYVEEYDYNEIFSLYNPDDGQITIDMLIDESLDNMITWW